MELDRPRLTRLLVLAACLSSCPSFSFSQAVYKETVEVIGWNKQCSVAVAQLGFPKLGEAIADEPLRTRLGTLTIAPGENEAAAAWSLELDGRGSWDPRSDAEARAALKKAGYTLPGYPEIFRDAPVAQERDLPRLLLSTDTFKASAPGWPPGRDWRLARVHYAPFSSPCALFVYQGGTAERPVYNLILLRLGNPTIRYDRADARVTNALLLFEKGKLTDAIEEARIAASLAPEHALSRYTYGEMLALDGEVVAALDELEAAIRLDPANKRKARKDKDYESLRRERRFKELTRK